MAELKALEYARLIAFPRLSGTSGEEKALSLITETFKKSGLSIREERFRVSLFPRIFQRISLSWLILLLLFSKLIASHHPLIASLLLFTVISLIPFSNLAFLFFMKFVSIKDSGKGKVSKNIIAHLAGGEKNKKARLYLIAHYDSKSQSISLPARIFCLISGVTAMLLLATCYLLQSFQIFLSASSLLSSLLTVIALTPFTILFSIRTGNKSPGALDNAGGIGLLLELAGVYSKHQPENLELNFVATGAEELGLLGAFVFLREHRAELENSYFINLDGIGVKGKLRINSRAGLISNRSSKKLASIMVKAAQEVGLCLRSFHLLPGVMMDHLPLAGAGLPAISLSCISKRGRWIHTENDRMDLVDAEGLREANLIIQKTVEWLDNHPSQSIVRRWLSIPQIMSSLRVL